MSRWVSRGAAQETEKEDPPQLWNQGSRFVRYTGDARENSKQTCHHIGELELLEAARARDAKWG